MRRAARALATVLAAAALAACAAFPVAPPAGDPAGPGVAVVATRTSVAQGRLVLSIRWPDGPGRDLRGYRAQLVPDSTATLKVIVKKGATTISSTDVNRPSGQAVTNATIQLNADTGLTVTVEAYPSGANSGTKVAEASQANLTIRSSADTSLTVSLGSLYTPSITGTSASYARAGDSLTITGSNLAPAWRGSGPTVLFPGPSGTVAATPTSVSDTSLTVAVPSGAQSGNVAVKVDGVTGGSAAFEIGATLTIGAGGTIPASTATYKAKVERDADSNGSYETTLYTTAAIPAGSMPTQQVIPQGGNFRVTLDAHPGANEPSANGGSIAVGTTTLAVNSGTTTAATTVSLSPRYTPAIAAVDDTTPAPGQSFTITGSNFAGAWRASGPTVMFTTFGASASATPTAADDSSLTVTMPSNAIKGAITVTVDGLESATFDLEAGAGIASYSGSLEALAINTSGTVFQALARSDLSCAFSVDSGDTWSVDDPFYPPHPATGRDGVSPPGGAFLTETGYKGALIVKRGTNTYQYVGLGATIVPTSGETLRFLINDDPIFDYRHTGSLTVSYTCTLQ
ncbi:MAG: IPT/TIG domain-containing protein [Candidatus Sericytochromatia bacterium]|nr:IPT/TIG domain-containing protein [Candidatus Tanganyikabacteria bacterium]